MLTAYVAQGRQVRGSGHVIPPSGAGAASPGARVGLGLHKCGFRNQAGFTAVGGSGHRTHKRFPAHGGVRVDENASCCGLLWPVVATPRRSRDGVLDVVDIWLQSSWVSLQRVLRGSTDTTSNLASGRPSQHQWEVSWVPAKELSPTQPTMTALRKDSIEHPQRYMYGLISGPSTVLIERIDS